jgi:hypothetical protein
MTFAVVYTAEAADDIDEAIDWLRFLECQALSLICCGRSSEPKVIFNEIRLSTAWFARRDWATYVV